jgi:hypothetical protein
MKFFSNDAKENTDDEREHGDVVTSDPVAVPQQRAGSPWSDTPGAQSEGGPVDRETREDETREDTKNDWGHAPEGAPATTTYGPDGTVTSSETESERESDEDADDDLEAKDSSLKDEGTFDSPAAVDPASGEPLDESDTRSDDDLSDRSDTELDRESDADGKAQTDAETDAETDSADDLTAADDRTETERERDTELADDSTNESADGVNTADRTVEDTDRGPEAVDPTTGESFDDTRAEPFEPVPVAVVGVPERVDAVDTATDTDSDLDDHTDDDSVVDDTSGDAVPVVAAVPVETAAAMPGTVTEPTLDRLFPGGDSFAERFREIQLVFVDTPKEATAQAAALVAEAVQSVTTALTQRKDSLAADSDDTENLRVELRGYRDLLNRITGL